MSEPVPSWHTLLVLGLLVAALTLWAYIRDRLP